MLTCERCKGRLLSVSLRGHLETLRCSGCGHVQFAMIVPGDEVGGYVNDGEKAATRLLPATAAFTRNDILSVRKLLPELADSRILEVAAQMDGASGLDVGLQSKDEAIAFAREARRLGLRVSWGGTAIEPE